MGFGFSSGLGSFQAQTKAIELQRVEQKWQQFDGFGDHNKDGKLSLKELNAARTAWESSGLPEAAQQIALIDEMISKVEAEGTKLDDAKLQTGNPFSPKASFLDFRQADVYASPTHKVFAENAATSRRSATGGAAPQGSVSLLRLQMGNIPTQEPANIDTKPFEEMLSKELTSSELRSASSKIESLKQSGSVGDVDKVFLQSLYGYTTNDYRQINPALRSGEPEKMAAQKTYIEGIDKGLDAMPVYQGVVWRGTNLPEDVLSQYEPGKVIQEKAYVSTTQKKSATNSFHGNTLFVIQTKEGESNGREVDGLSAYANEKEVLFKRDTQFEVLAKEANPKRPSQNIIYLQEI